MEGEGGEKTRWPAACHRWPAERPGVKGIKGRGNGRGLKAAINCLNWLAQAGGEEEGGSQARR
jgi:hypothetical protein